MNWILTLSVFGWWCGLVAIATGVVLWANAPMNDGRYRGWHSLTLFVIGAALISIGAGAS